MAPKKGEKNVKNNLKKKKRKKNIRYGNSYGVNYIMAQKCILVFCTGSNVETLSAILTKTSFKRRLYPLELKEIKPEILTVGVNSDQFALQNCFCVTRRIIHTAYTYTYALPVYRSQRESILSSVCLTRSIFKLTLFAAQRAKKKKKERKKKKKRKDLITW